MISHRDIHRNPRGTGPWPAERTDPGGSCATPRARIGGTGKTLSEAMVLLELNEVRERVEVLEEQANQRSAIVPIQSLDPLAVEVIQPVLAVVQQEDGVFVASFVDANINASGESQLDAVEMLKDIIASSFQLFLNKEPVLGEEPKRTVGGP